MIIGSHNTNERVFIIAEIGNNHEGDFGLAKDLIALAAESGADAVKFQTIVPSRLISPRETDRVKHFSRFQFSYDQFAELAQEAAQKEVMFMSTPFDIQSADFLDSIVPAFKIASGDNTFYPLIDAVAQTGKPIIMSTGLACEDVVTQTRDRILNVWDEKGLADPGLALLHCRASYPTPLEEANLSSIGLLAGLGVTPGYSDHTLGVEAAIASVACGARIIEKHFTIDKQFSEFRDHQLSADPQDLRALVDGVRKMETMLGSPIIKEGACELEGKPLFRRSIVAADNIPAGTTISMKHLSWVRPGGGLEPGREHELIGKAAKRPLEAGERIALENVE